MSIPLLRVGGLQVLGWVDCGRWVVGGSGWVLGNHLPTGNLGGSGRDQETYGGPVSVPMLQALLVLIEGIGLNVYEGTCWRLHLGYFPSDNISDISTGLKTTKYNYVAALDCFSFPKTGIDGDSELDTCLDFLLLNALDMGVKDLVAFPRAPVPAEGILIEAASWYLISTGVVSRLSAMPPTVVGRETVTALIEIGSGEARGGWNIVAGVNKGGLVVVGGTMVENVRGGLRGRSWGGKQSGHRWSGYRAHGGSTRLRKKPVKEVLGHWWGGNGANRGGLKLARGRDGG
jgi:hypothetical protein